MRVSVIRLGAMGAEMDPSTLRAGLATTVRELGAEVAATVAGSASRG